MPKAKWSQRNNNNYQQTALLTTLHYFSNNTKLFLKNFYLKSKRSIEKPKNEGPAAYVFPGDDPRPGNQAELLRTLQAQGVEIIARPRLSRFAEAKKNTEATQAEPVACTDIEPVAFAPPSPQQTRDELSRPAVTSCAWTNPTVASPTPCSTISTGRQTIRKQNVYDDTAWTMGELANVEVVRVTDMKALSAPMERVTGDVRSRERCSAAVPIYLINHNADNVW